MGCLGAEDDPPADLHFIPQLRPGDVLLACSDGVWHYFSPSELGSVLSSLSPREATEFLIEKARSRAPRRRRQPVAGDRQARAAGQLSAAAAPAARQRPAPARLGRAWRCAARASALCSSRFLQPLLVPLRGSRGLLGVAAAVAARCARLPAAARAWRAGSRGLRPAGVGGALGRLLGGALPRAPAAPPRALAALLGRASCCALGDSRSSISRRRSAARRLRSASFSAISWRRRSASASRRVAPWPSSMQSLTANLP